MNTQAHNQKHTKEGRELKLKRIESTWVSMWLDSLGINVPGGWVGIYRLTVDQVAEKYGVEPADVEAAAKGEKR